MSKFKITILGTTAGVPTKERGHAAVYITYRDRDDSTFLMDCGEGTQRQIMSAGLNIMRIDEIFITHWHGDHCLGLPGAIDTMGFEGRERPLSVHAPEAWRIDGCLGFNPSMGRFGIMPGDVPVKGNTPFLVSDHERYSVVSVPVKHSVPSVAYAVLEKDRRVIDKEKAAAKGLPEKSDIYARLKSEGSVDLKGNTITLEEVSVNIRGRKIVYSGDTEICDNLRELCRGADLLIQDCTYMEDPIGDKPHKHATLPDVMRMTKEGEVKRTILTHISRKYRDPDKIQELLNGRTDLELAYDLMKIEI